MNYVEIKSRPVRRFVLVHPSIEYNSISMTIIIGRNSLFGRLECLVECLASRSWLNEHKASESFDSCRYSYYNWSVKWMVGETFLIYLLLKYGSQQRNARTRIYWLNTVNSVQFIPIAEWIQYFFKIFAINATMTNENHTFLGDVAPW